MKILGIIIAIFSFLLLVVSHEFGHMIVGKICGVRVDEFSVGMGPLIFKKQKKETQYSLRAIPIGGYCKFGEDEEESDDPRSFINAVWWKRAFIIFAGAFMNFLVCLIILVSVFTYIGSYSPKLSAVNNGSPAALAGIEAGDTILAINDEYSNDWATIVDSINKAKGDKLKITFHDASSTDKTSESSVYVSPEYDEASGRNLIGIQCSIVHSVKASFKQTISVCKEFVVETFKFLGRLFTGKAQGDEVMGVVGIVNTVSEELQYGFVNVIYLMGIISLNLAVINLLPFPALDGGRLLLIFIELITHNKVSKKVEGAINTVGFMFLLALAVLLIFKDTFNLIVK